MHPGYIQLIRAARLIQRVQNAADSPGMPSLESPGPRQTTVTPRIPPATWPMRPKASWV
jgi:hypothetical protein